MDDYKLRITTHAYKCYRQRVGNLPLKLLMARSQTALQCGLYQHDEGLIKLCGIWWATRIKGRQIVLVTCLGRQDHNLIHERLAK